MVKCCFLVYRKPGLSREEFSDYWARVHSRIAIETAPVTGMVRYLQNHVLDHPIAALFQASRNCHLGDFDGMAEAWWPSFEAMEAAAGSTPQHVAETILADEARFIDLERSVIFFVEEMPFLPQEEGGKSQS